MCLLARSFWGYSSTVVVSGIVLREISWCFMLFSLLAINVILLACNHVPKFVWGSTPVPCPGWYTTASALHFVIRECLCMLYFKDASGRVRDMSCLHFISRLCSSKCMYCSGCVDLVKIHLGLRCQVCFSFAAFGTLQIWYRVRTCKLVCVSVYELMRLVPEDNVDVCIHWFHLNDCFLFIREGETGQSIFLHKAGASNQIK